MPRTRSLSPAARAVAALAPALALLAGCAPAPGAADLDADGAGALTGEIADLAGVAEVTSAGSGATGDPTELSVATDVTSSAEFVALAADVADLLPADARTTARVWQGDVPGLPDLAVQVARRDERVDERLDALADVAALPVTTGVQLLPDSISATTADVTGLPALAAAVEPFRVPSVMLGTDDRRVTSYVGSGVLDAQVARLVARIDAWPGVTSQLLGDEGTDEAWVQVQVRGDDTVEGLADALARKGWPVDAAAVHVVVASSFRERGVVVGRPDAPAEDDPATDGDEPAAAPAGDLPACPGTELDLRIAGFDAAAGRRYLTLLARNGSGTACTVEGRPEITFVRESGTPVPDLETGTPTGTAAPQRVVLEPGHAARSDLTWRGMSTALDPDVTVELQVAAVPGTGTASIPVDGSGLDILAGAAVEIGAWLPADG